MKGYWGFLLNTGEIIWIKKSDVKGVRLLELCACFNEQMR